MPRKPKQPCAYPNCNKLCEGRYCEEHKRLTDKSYNSFSRPKDTNKKYGRAWRKVRERYVQSHPLCEQCLKEGRMTPTEEVHHIKPISQGDYTPQVTKELHKAADAQMAELLNYERDLVQISKDLLKIIRQDIKETLNEAVKKLGSGL